MQLSIRNKPMTDEEFFRDFPLDDVVEVEELKDQIESIVKIEK